MYSSCNSVQNNLNLPSSLTLYQKYTADVRLSNQFYGKKSNNDIHNANDPELIPSVTFELKVRG